MKIDGYELLRWFMLGVGGMAFLVLVLVGVSVLDSIVTFETG